MKVTDDTLQYMEDFTEKALELSKLPLQGQPSIPDKNKQVEQMIEDYFVKTGRYPRPYDLTLLSNYILSSDLKDRDVDKVSNNEYPVLSEYQMKRRDSKQITMETDTINFLDAKQNKGLDSLAKTPVKKPVY